MLAIGKKRNCSKRDPTGAAWVLIEKVLFIMRPPATVVQPTAAPLALSATLAPRNGTF